MTAALMGYSGVFMRYSMMVTPKNYLLFGCHIVNFSAQATQAYRFTNYWYMGGKDKAEAQKAKEGLKGAADEVKDAAQEVKKEGQGVVEKIKEKVQ